MSSGRYIDAHCHLADPRLDSGRDALIAECEKRGIGAFIQGGVDPEDWERQLELVRRYPGRVFPCFGIHPWVSGATPSDSGRLERALDELPKYLQRGVGLGETGLDHGRKMDPAGFARQEQVFKHQLEIVRSRPLPLILHIVHAHAEALAILEELGPFPRGGLVHSFGGSREIADRYLKLGFTISVGGSVTRKGFETLKRAVVGLPLDRIVIESDSPDQIPEGFEGWTCDAATGTGASSLNDPRSLWTVAEAIGSLRRDGISAAGLLDRSRENLIRIFGLESETGTI